MVDLAAFEFLSAGLNKDVGALVRSLRANYPLSAKDKCLLADLLEGKIKRARGARPWRATDDLRCPEKAAVKPATHAGLVITRNYQMWDHGEDILALQTWLNGNGFVIAVTGPGSPGNETTTFGLHTYQALTQFQSAHGLPATGYLGPLTRALINSPIQ